jgi:hypothetical protein
MKISILIEVLLALESINEMCPTRFSVEEAEFVMVMYLSVASKVV